jgi:hypothetical protein
MTKNGEENRFKFRAWNDDYDEMVYSTTEHDCDLKREFVPWLFEVGYSSFPREGWIIMQCIDVKDKLGKLIYDGDILKIIQQYRDYDGGPILYRTLTGQITFDCGCFWFRGSGWNINNWFHYEFSELEIIGNVYENPELLPPELEDVPI